MVKNPSLLPPSTSARPSHMLTLPRTTTATAMCVCVSLQGDPHMARHLQSPYRLVQLPAEVQLELQVPFWVQPTEDVKVDIGQRGLAVEVDGVMRLHRTFSWDEAQAAKQGSSYKVRQGGRQGGTCCSCYETAWVNLRRRGWAEAAAGSGMSQL